MIPLTPEDQVIRDALMRYRRIAVVGLSNRPQRPSYGVAAYLQQQGYQIFPVNPLLKGQYILGEVVYGSLSELPEPPQIVDVFRRSEYVSEVVDGAISVGAKVVWTQLDVRDDAAAARARAAGLLVVQDRCLKIEQMRLAMSSHKEQ